MKFHWFIWFPRIMMLVFALFLVVFSFDVFGGNQIFLYKLEGFLIHTIPTIVLLMILWLTWKRPMWGGLLFILVSLLFTLFFHTYRQWTSFLIITGGPLLIGILFILVHYMKVKENISGEEKKTD
jgi:hypothetical protein